MITFTFAHVVQGLERKSSLVDLSVSLGRRLRYKLQKSRDSVAACHTGWFILVSYFELGLIELVKKHSVKKGRKSKYPTYTLRVNDSKKLMSLWELVGDHHEVDLFPLKKKPDPWDSTIHNLGLSVIKKASVDALKKFGSDQQYIYDVLNKLSSTPWMINSRVLEAYEFFLNNKPDDKELNPFKFFTTVEAARRASLEIEAKAIFRLAKMCEDGFFYHLYNCDFR